MFTSLKVCDLIGFQLLNQLLSEDDLKRHLWSFSNFTTDTYGIKLGKGPPGMAASIGLGLGAFVQQTFARMVLQPCQIKDSLLLLTSVFDKTV